MVSRGTCCWTSWQDFRLRLAIKKKTVTLRRDKTRLRSMIGDVPLDLQKVGLGLGQNKTRRSSCPAKPGKTLRVDEELILWEPVLIFVGMALDLSGSSWAAIRHRLTKEHRARNVPTRTKTAHSCVHISHPGFVQQHPHPITPYQPLQRSDPSAPLSIQTRVPLHFAPCRLLTNGSFSSFTASFSDGRFASSLSLCTTLIGFAWSLSNTIRL